MDPVQPQDAGRGLLPPGIRTGGHRPVRSRDNGQGTGTTGLPGHLQRAPVQGGPLQNGTPRLPAGPCPPLGGGRSVLAHNPRGPGRPLPEGSRGGRSRAAPKNPRVQNLERGTEPLCRKKSPAGTASLLAGDPTEGGKAHLEGRHWENRGAQARNKVLHPR